MCVLRVTGKNFDPAKYLASSTIKPYSVFRAGEQAEAKGRIHRVSGFKVDVSRRSWNNLTSQVADAIAFLQKHRNTLAKLRSIPEVEDVRLVFPLNLRINKDKVFAQFDYFPPELVSLAGALDCGLEMSIYPRDLYQRARSRRKSRNRSGTAQRPRGGKKNSRR
jgi:hypothetical protein